MSLSETAKSAAALARRLQELEKLERENPRVFAAALLFRREHEADAEFLGRVWRHLGELPADHLAAVEESVQK